MNPQQPSQTRSSPALSATPAPNSSHPLPAKRPLAPAPLRPGLSTGPASSAVRPMATNAILMATSPNDEENYRDLEGSEIDDEDDEDLLIPPPTGGTTTGVVSSSAAGNANPASSSVIRPATSGTLFAELEGGDGGGQAGEGGDSGDEFEELEELLVEDDLQADRDEMIRNRIAASQDAMKNILDSLTVEQLQRYETFRRVGLPRPTIKKILEDLWRPSKERAGSAPTSAALANSINANTIIAISGIAKVFIGELVEEAKLVQEKWGDDSRSPLMPFHIIEAHRQLKECPSRHTIVPRSRNYRKSNPFL